MATKIRLQRHGRKRKPFYHVVVADARAPRDGRIVEKLGTFNPNVEPPLVELNFDNAVKWVLDGATPTDTVRMILSKEGVMFKKHLQVGVNKGAIKQEDADKKFDAWKASKESADQSRLDGEAKDKASKIAKAQAEREEVRAAAAKKQKEEEEAALKATAEAEAAAKAEAAAANATEVVFADAVVLIDGIGPKGEETLKEAGITTLTQVAAWTEEDIKAIEEKIGKEGIVAKEEWIEQAKEMISGKEPRSKTDQDLAAKMLKEQAESTEG